ncbi:prepilin-type N-terminal cleavage/methylation domain-containing protein [Roseateles sp. BYS180W]|uniref:Prepilin-type N-terminal cleavage/methylation domain-containing protein n=1 Tax=Roseateles rivi TaxID=3299028 RepID=A0ABW7FXU6_9BURK
MTPRPSSTSNQRGASLLEVLVASLVLAVGLLGLVALQRHWRVAAEHGQQMSEAATWVRQQLAQQRGLIGPPNEQELPFAGRNTAYTGTQRWQLDEAGVKQALSTEVLWLNRMGQPARLQLHSLLTDTDPVLSLSLSVAAAHHPWRPHLGRHAAIPPQAVDLGEWSLERPWMQADEVWIWERDSGLLLGRCRTDVPPAQLSAAALRACMGKLKALPISGHVQFSDGGLPQEGAAVGPAYPLRLELVQRESEDAAPAECFDDAPAAPKAQAMVRYLCVVPLQPDRPRWSGRLLLQHLPLTPGGLRVCRYSADLDGDGDIEREEHPARYENITQALIHQNFLVIPFGSSCPGLRGQGTNQPAQSWGTQAHQP